MIGESFGFAAAARHHEDIAVNDEGDETLVVRKGELGGAAGEVDDALGVGLIIGVTLDGQLAWRAADGVDDPQVGAALVDDPLAVAADTCPAHAVVLVHGELLRSAAYGARLHLQLLPYDVRRRAEHL